MYFVRNFINKLSRKDRKEPINFKKEWWDCKHVVTGAELCKTRGHNWKMAPNGNQAICSQCDKVQELKWDGNEGP